MEEIKIIVANKIASVEGTPTIICGNSDYVINFTFDAEWDEYSTKTARFVFLLDGGIRYIDVVFDGNECQAPILSNIDNVKVGVFAGNLCTTTGATIKCQKSILCDSGNHKEPDDNTYNEIMEMFNTKFLEPNAVIDASYNPTSENAQSGKAVAEAVEEVADYIGMKQVNIFNYQDVTTGLNRNPNLGKSITKYYEVTDGFYSNQIWTCKQGDIIRCNMSWAYILIYDVSGVLIEKWNTQEDVAYEVTSETAAQFTYQGVSYQATDDVMITLNREMPSTIVPYQPTSLVDRVSILEEQANNAKKYFNKPFVVLSFDTFNLDDNRFAIVNGEYGYKATVAHRTAEHIATNKTVLNAGWDIGLYLFNNELYPPTIYGMETAVSSAPTDEVLNAWETYVKSAIDEAELAGVYNSVVWLCRQGCSCYGLETALKKYGIPMCRGSYNPDYSNDWLYSPDELPTMTVAPKQTLMPSTLEDCKTNIAEAIESGNGVAFITHSIYATDEEANSNYGITEACLREFLDTIKTYVDAGQLEVVTYRDIYAMYYQDEAKELDYNRIIKMAGIEEPDGEANVDLSNYYTKAEIDTMIGDIDVALDGVIAIQNELIGGESV